MDKQKAIDYIRSLYTLSDGTVVDPGAEHLALVEKRFDAYLNAYAKAKERIAGGRTWNRWGAEHLAEVLADQADSEHLWHSVLAKVAWQEGVFREMDDERLVMQMRSWIDQRLEAYAIMKENLNPDGSRDLAAEGYAIS